MAFPDGTTPGVCTGLLEDDSLNEHGGHGGQGAKETYGAHGVRSVEDAVPVTPDTLFRVASISKLITATALTELGVDLDAPVRRHLPGFRVAEAGVGERVTVRDLVTHRSGWAPDHTSSRPADESDAGALARAVADLAAAPQIFPPGRLYGYSNAGFVVLARIVEAVAGEPYEHAVRRLVFEPAGMERATFFADEAITRPVALGHTGTPARVVRPWGRSRARNGAGGLMASARDLIAYARYMLARPHRMWEPLDDAVGGMGDRVGVAWHLQDLPGGGRAAGHSGLTAGYTSRLTIVPGEGRAFVVLANSDQAVREVSRATERALGLPSRPLSDEERDHAYVSAPDVGDHLGVYTDGAGDTRVDGAGDGVVLTGEVTGGEARRVRFTGPDEGVDEHGGIVRFIRDGGAVAWMRVDGAVLRRTSLGASGDGAGLP